MRLLYTVLLHLAIAAAVPYLVIRSILDRAYRSITISRLGFIPRLRSPVKIWFHCSSVGETLALGPLYRAVLGTVRPGEIAISTMTPSGMAIAKKSYPGTAAFFYLPFDTPWAMTRALGAIRPAVIVLLETEFWPNMLAAARSGGIPVLLMNGRISRGSFRWYTRLRGLFGPGLGGLAAAGMQTEEARGRLIALGGNPGAVQVTGNLKFDFPDLPASGAGVQALSGGIAGGDLIVAGSTHGGEEEIVLDAFRMVLGERPAAKLLLAPRHLDRIPQVEAVVSGKGLRSRRKSEFVGSQSPDGDAPVIILDTMGELAGIYGLASAVFVGGSLIPRGGHNIVEPVMAKKAVAFGPSMESFPEARDIILSSGGGTVVRDAADLGREFLGALTNPAEYARRGKMAYDAVQSGRGAAARDAAMIAAYL